MKQLQAFYRLTGPVPLIPKFTLGNWWSRYRAYTQEEYRSLMQTFLDKQIPITVATIDMDWHWTDVLRRFGKEAAPPKAKAKEEILYNTILPGWTGYTWNTELFPDHRELLRWLHEKGFKVPLNVHPSQGIRFFENNYEAMCKRMGIDPASKQAVAFDPADPKFLQAYFEEIHHPLEAEGVDFWWLDWQQGKVTDIPGLDPLWALNHFHSRDFEKRGKRPLILSRYAGLGSHRYPLGFSGDAKVTWKSLAFQPYFTNTAANAGYGWWSHDIGGHCMGVQDDELYLRWLQYGVFSPVNRLHSTNSEYMGKEPWKRSWAVEKIAENFLRLRHKLIPYLYSANYRAHTQGTPICMPLYYRYDTEDARRAKNQYLFGDGLLVSPIVKRSDRRLNLAAVETWLPAGRWTDIFSGRIYEGGRWVKLYRDLDAIPVLAKEGAIVPMYRQDRTNDLSLAQPLEIHIWRGNGTFELYEDDGQTMDYEKGICAITRFDLQEQGDTLKLTITPPEDNHGLLPAWRQMYIRFEDVQAEEICVRVGNEPVQILLENIRRRENAPKEELKSNLLTRIQGKNLWKERHFKRTYPKFVREALQELDALWYVKGS
jgi:alpha-glucosidase (family GH31 glycosyl hydrolase)